MNSISVDEEAAPDGQLAPTESNGKGSHAGDEVYEEKAGASRTEEAPFRSTLFESRKIHHPKNL